MRLWLHILVIISLSWLTGIASATPDHPQNGVDYFTVKQPQASDDKRIEVIEFFSYDCPHCADFEPILAAWAQKKHPQVVLKQVPVAGFFYNDLFQQKLFYALEAMRNAQDIDPKMKAIIHPRHINPKIFQAAQQGLLANDEAMLAFLEKQGIDRQKFDRYYHSFGVPSAVRQAKQLQEAYRVNAVPLVVIDGHYITAPAMPQDLLQVMDFLVAKRSKDKKLRADPVSKSTSKNK